jgi:hypothetical protein
MRWLIKLPIIQNRTNIACRTTKIHRHNQKNEDSIELLDSNYEVTNINITNRVGDLISLIFLEMINGSKCITMYRNHNK